MIKRTSFNICVINMFLFSLNLFSQTTYKAKCISVEDGDTFTVLYNNGPIKIRIHGIDAPEGTQDYGDMAALNLRYLIVNKTLLIKAKYSDRFGRTVADVFLSDRDIGLHMIKSGLAWHYKKYSNDSVYNEAEKEAQNRGIGLWGLQNPIPPWNYRGSGNKNTNAPIQTSLTSNQVTEQAIGADTVYITKAGSKYHRLGCTSLRMSKIEKSLLEAVNAGYLPCRICNPPIIIGTKSSLVSSESKSAAANTSFSSSTSSSSYRNSSSGGGQCQATTKKGSRCKRKAKAGSNYCWQHG